MKEKSVTIDIQLLVVTLLLIGTGVVMVLSSSAIIANDRYHDTTFYLKRQLMWLAIGVVVMWAFANSNYLSLRKYNWILLALSIVLLVLLYIPNMGKSVGGAKRWLRLGGLIFQPSEIVKFAIVLYLAGNLSRNSENIKTLKGIFIPLSVTALCSLLILFQPDFGTAFILSIIAITMIYVAGVKVAHIVVLSLCAMPFLIHLMVNASYRYKRLLAFLDPWTTSNAAGFQMIQSFLAFGSGGIFGVGLSNAHQKFLYLPAPHTDFIFSIIGEELGLIGALIVWLFFLVFIIRGISIAKATQEMYGKLLATGFTFLIGIEAFINMGVATGLLPTKGTTLPFVSYGGSSLVIKMALVGILLNISKQKFRHHFT